LHTRVITLIQTEVDAIGVPDIVPLISYTRESLVEKLRTQKGYQGAVVSVSRWQGVIGVLSLWDTETALKASDTVVEKSTKKGLNAALRVEDYDQLLENQREQPAVGSFLMATTFRIPPANIDPALAIYEGSVLPRMRAYPGFQALRIVANRNSGHGLVWAVWTDRETMTNGAIDVIARRSEATRLEISFGEVSFREILLTDLP
jgi:hypothetical protein